MYGSPVSYGVKSRLNSLRCTLEDWLALEIRRDELQGPEFFDVYYHEADASGSAWEKASSQQGSIELLEELKTILVSNYPECDPLKREVCRVDKCLALVGSQITRS